MSLASWALTAKAVPVKAELFFWLSPRVLFEIGFHRTP
jgi:hypothetical protein